MAQTNATQVPLFQALRDDMELIGKLIALADPVTPIDLTESVFDAIEAIHQCHYQAIKQLLPSREQRWISYQQVEEATSPWMYYPLQQLMKTQYSGEATTSNPQKIDHVIVGE